MDRDNPLFPLVFFYASPAFLPKNHARILEEIVHENIPEKWKNLATSRPLTPSFFSEFFSEAIPIFRFELKKEERICACTCIIPGEYTQGAGRYINDTLSRWLIPGKPLQIPFTSCFSFAFQAHPPLYFFCSHSIIAADTVDDFLRIEQNLPTLFDQFRVHLMAGYFARYITALRGTDPLNQEIIVDERLFALFGEKATSEPNLYDHSHALLGQQNAEKKREEIRHQISHFLSSRPKDFDRDIFYEVHATALLFQESLAQRHSPRYISRLIAYYYLFKKILVKKMSTHPQEKHLSSKALMLQSRSKAAVLLGITLTKETERFDTKNFTEALQATLPTASIVENTLLADRSHDLLRFFYCEIEKEVFSLEDIAALKTKLRSHALERIENVTHPIFLPRNEEELLRSQIVLNAQLQRKRDLPQVSIYYEKQTEESLTFTVLVARLLLPSTPPWDKQKLLASPTVRFSIDTIKVLGYLRKKYPKESTVFQVQIEKKPFFRADYSVDILKARQKIAQELKTFIGEFRDFNGGMILKQEESLDAVRLLVDPQSTEEELLLEKYFYSLHPAVTHALYEPSLLHDHFVMLRQSLFPRSPSIQREKKHLLFWVRGISPEEKETLLEEFLQLQIPSYEYATVCIQTTSDLYFGAIFRHKEEETISRVLQKIEEVLSLFLVKQ